MPRRDDLPPLGRALSDALDDVNHRFHGLTSSWAHPDEFLESLREDGYDVVAIVDRERAEQAEAAIARLRAALAAFDGRGVLGPDGANFDVPTPGEVLDAWRAALDDRGSTSA